MLKEKMGELILKKHLGLDDFINILLSNNYIVEVENLNSNYVNVTIYNKINEGGN